MCPEHNRYELSVIVPTLNEAALIDALLRSLADQRGPNLEVLICDGGSTDATVEKALGIAAELPFPLRVITGEKGRGRQMNAGARAAQGEYLLFLHADSLFPDQQALSTALKTLQQEIEETGRHLIAGRFRLLFRRTATTSSFFYYYLECKARLDRVGCTHGDQGFLLSRALFMEAGPFDESCTVLEDTRFAETVRRTGRWLLFGPEIVTSARRYETEGAAKRQILNAVIMALDAVGRDDMIRELPGIYSAQKGYGQLRLLPFLQWISRMLADMPWRKRVIFWQGIGGCMVRNAWQPAFALDVSRNFRKGLPPGRGEKVWLRLSDRLPPGLLASPPVKLAAACMAWFLFRCIMLFSGRKGLGTS